MAEKEHVPAVENETVAVSLDANAPSWLATQPVPDASAKLRTPHPTVVVESAALGRTRVTLTFPEDTVGDSKAT